MRKFVVLAFLAVAGVALIAFTFIPTSSKPSKPVSTVFTPVALYANGHILLCSSGAALSVAAQKGEIRPVVNNVFNTARISDGFKSIPSRNCVAYVAPPMAGEDRLAITEGKNVFMRTVTIYEDKF